MMHKITFALLAIGGLNWLLEAFGWGLASWMSAEWWGTLTMVVYILVGLSAIYEIVTHMKNCKMCEKKDVPAQPMMK